MKFTILFLCCMALPAFCVEPQNELQKACQSGSRFVSNAEVDISPLIKWRETRRGYRPLQAWHYMTGKILSIKPGQWVMEVQIEGEPDTRKILLRHPPETALAEFRQVKQEFASTRTNAKVTSEAADDALLDRAGTRRNAINTEAPRRGITTQDRQALREKRQADREYRRAHAESVSAHEEAVVANKKLRQFDAKGYNVNDDFKFFGYAFKTKETSLPENLPVYDHGKVIYR